MTIPTSNPQSPALRILLVEDNPLLALDVKATLAELGYCVIGPVDAVAPALQIINTSRLDVAVLDINLGTELSFPIADALTAVDVPFLFLTAHDRAIVPDAHSLRLLISKPFVPQALAGALALMLAV